MRSEIQSSKSSTRQGSHLSLVSASSRTGNTTRSSSVIETTPDTATIKQLTLAMMNHLWIPGTTTIVGLLDVGLSHSNFDELSKWIVGQIATMPDGDAATELSLLERRFHRTIDRFPEQ